MRGCKLVARRRPASRALPGWLLATALAVPGLAQGAPEDDEDLVIIDDDDDDDDDGALDDAMRDDDDDELGDDDDASEPTSSPESGGAGASGSASASLGGGAKASGRKKREKKPRKKREKKPFDIEDYVPENHTLELGFHFGGFFLGKNHSLFDGFFGPQPEVDRSTTNFGFRLTYLPIPWVGAAFESTLMPTRSDMLDARALMWTVRGHVTAQIPYRITPTFVMGGGFVRMQSSQDEALNGSDTLFYYGPGGKFYINDWVAVRLEARHIVMPNGDDSRRVQNGELFVGIDLLLRAGKWAGNRDGRNEDRDNDGYPDDEDQCPDIAGDDEPPGCPANLDTDKDGVPDREDGCPNKYGDGPDGCPVPDMDGDGITDSYDNCVDEPENYNGFEDTDGCPDEQPEEVKQLSGVMEGINFDSGRATIKKGSRPVLDKAIETLKKYPTLRLKITGHTDDRGKRDTNMALSQERADAVKQYMIDVGIEASRLSTEGKGPDSPIADNKTKAGRAQNRRIEFEVVEPGA